MSATPLYPLQFDSIYRYRLWGGRRLGPDGPLKGSTSAELVAQSPDELLGVFAGRLSRWHAG
jgi:hypothetical protein